MNKRQSEEITLKLMYHTKNILITDILIRYDYSEDYYAQSET